MLFSLPEMENFFFPAAAADLTLKAPEPGAAARDPAPGRSKPLYPIPKKLS